LPAAFRHFGHLFSKALYKYLGNENICLKSLHESQSRQGVGKYYCSPFPDGKVRHQVIQEVWEEPVFEYRFLSRIISMAPAFV